MSTKKKTGKPKSSVPTAAEPSAEPKKVLVLRTCNADMSTHGGFKWPESGPVECPDWSPTPECGYGLHGLLWGDGDYTHLSSDAFAKWLVVEVLESEIVSLGDKVKFPRGNVIYAGQSAGAMKILRDRTWGVAPSVVASSTGDDSVACCLGYDSKVKSSMGPLVCAYHDGSRRRIAVAYPGENGIKPDTWYQVTENGKFVEVEP